MQFQRVKVACQSAAAVCIAAIAGIGQWLLRGGSIAFPHESGRSGLNGLLGNLRVRIWKRAFTLERDGLSV